MILREVAVDANPMMAALLGGIAARVLAVPTVSFLTTERTIWEVRKYLPVVAERLGDIEEGLLRDLEDTAVETVPALFYQAAMPTALAAIGQRDAKDAELLALALALQIPIWSNDRDFQNIRGVTVYTTAELAASVLPSGGPSS
jgi:predicted nucleic acid-binding protein